jgi:hypothetical protein
VWFERESSGIWYSAIGSDGREPSHRRRWVAFCDTRRRCEPEKTEARVTLVDAYLAGAVLVGLILNALFGWWWADPIAGLVIVYYGLREGWHAWHEANAAGER